jgi:putative membrane protein
VVPRWAWFAPIAAVGMVSLCYEQVEMLAALVFGGDLGQAYLGTQGDIWDAHKDMALASLGALVAMLVTFLINRRYQRDFNREWAESLRVKGKRPLGEDALARMVRKSGKKAGG